MKIKAIALMLLTLTMTDSYAMLPWLFCPGRRQDVRLRVAAFNLEEGDKAPEDNRSEAALERERRERVRAVRQLGGLVGLGATLAFSFGSGVGAALMCDICDYDPGCGFVIGSMATCVLADCLKVPHAIAARVMQWYGEGDIEFVESPRSSAGRGGHDASELTLDALKKEQEEGS